MYIRISISAKSAASTPPAPDADRDDAPRARRTRRTSRVRTSSSSTALLDLGELALGLGQRVGVALLLAELDQDLEVVDAAVHAGEPVELGLGAGEPAGDALRVLLVVPQVGGGDLLAEVGDLGLRARRGRSPPHGLHRRAEVLDLLGEVDSHEGQAYGRSGCRPPARRAEAADEWSVGGPAEPVSPPVGDARRPRRRKVGRRPRSAPHPAAAETERAQRRAGL